MSLKIVFMGTPEFSLPTLQALLTIQTVVLWKVKVNLEETKKRLRMEKKDTKWSPFKALDRADQFIEELSIPPLGKEVTKRQPKFRVNSIYGMSLAVENGAGLAALPDYMVADKTNLVRLSIKSKSQS